MADVALDWFIQSADKPWSFTRPDSATLRFELRPADHWADDYSTKVQRTELLADKTYPANTPIEITYNFMLEPGATTTAAWSVIGQMHSSNSSGSPPLSFDLRAGDHMEIGVGNGSPSNPDVWTIWTDKTPIIRGHEYSMAVDVKFSNDSKGYLQVWRDGIKIVNYKGPIGYGHPTYWKEGIYRPNAPETLAVNYSNLKIVTSAGTYALAGVGFSDTGTGRKLGLTGGDERGHISTQVGVEHRPLPPR